MFNSVSLSGIQMPALKPTLKANPVSQVAFSSSELPKIPLSEARVLIVDPSPPIRKLVGRNLLSKANLKAEQLLVAKDRKSVLRQLFALRSQDVKPENIIVILPEKIGKVSGSGIAIRLAKNILKPENFYFTSALMPEDPEKVKAVFPKFEHQSFPKPNFCKLSGGPRLFDAIKERLID